MNLRRPNASAATGTFNRRRSVVRQSGLSLGVLCITLGLLGFPCSIYATYIGVNLVANGDAETSSTGWTTSGNFQAFAYQGGNYPSLTDPGPPNRGSYFFYGGTAGSSSGSQSIDLTPIATDIDAGSLGFELSGYLGGYGTEGDYAWFTATFRDQNGTTLDSTSIGPVTASDRNYVTGLFLRSSIGLLPSGTRDVLLTVNMKLEYGVSTDAYADNLSFVVAPVPEPTTMIAGALLLLPFGVSAIRRFRKNRTG
ncbi:MAG: hypothetical protein AB9869_27190 [Verrucomicrobiia bacterium]